MYNRVFLTGRIKEEISLQYTNNEIPFVRFELIVDNANAYYKGMPDNIPCVIWRQNATLFFEKVKKMSLVLLEGRLRGQNNYLEVSVANFQVLTNENREGREKENREEKKEKTKITKTNDEELGIDWGDLKKTKKDD